MSEILVTLACFAVIAAIVWWFWLSKPKPRITDVKGMIEIVVDGGVYNPARIEIPVGKTTTLRFLRKDPNPCAEKVLFDQLGISAELEVEKPKDIEIKSDQPGEYEFTCQMGMYRGMLVVK